MTAMAKDLPARFATLFTPGAEIAFKRHRWPVSTVEVGPLHLPSGRIVIGDPIATIDYEALPRTAPRGVYRVEASLVALEPDDAPIGAVRVVFSQQPVVSWEAAGDGYAGTFGMLLDFDTTPAFARYIDACESEWWYQVSRQRGETWEYACFTPDDGRPETCVFFSADGGDGLCESYWGLDASGAPVVFVTDCNVMP